MFFGFSKKSHSVKYNNFGHIESKKLKNVEFALWDLGGATIMKGVAAIRFRTGLWLIILLLLSPFHLYRTIFIFTFILYSSFIVLSVRPKVTELVFQMYGRSLHPELFVIHQTQEVERGGYKARLQITNSGHVLCWQYAGLTLTEVAASAHNPLPSHRRLMAYKLQGSREDQIECRGGIVYETSFSLEKVRPEFFVTFQKELATEKPKQSLLHRFESSGRLGMGALSFIHLESRERSLTVQAIHTFPDDLAIVKTQSRFLLPNAK